MRVERRPVRRLGDARGVDGDREDAGAAEAERLELLAVVLRVAEREVDAAGQRRELVASERGEAEQRRIVRREVRRRRDVVVLQHAAGAERGKGLGHRRRQRVVEDRQLAPLRRRIGERPHVVPQIVVDGQRVELGLVAHVAQQIAHAPRAVADRVALVRRRHPLVDDHRIGIWNREFGIRTNSKFQILYFLIPSAPAAAPDRWPGDTCGALRAPARRRTGPRNRTRRAAPARAGRPGCDRRIRAACRRSPWTAADRRRPAGRRRSGPGEPRSRRSRRSASRRAADRGPRTARRRRPWSTGTAVAA